MYLNLTAEITFDHHTSAGDRIRNASNLLIGKLSSAGVRIDSGLIQNLCRCFGTNPVNIRERRLDALLIGNLDSE